MRSHRHFSTRPRKSLLSTVKDLDVSSSTIKDYVSGGSLSLASIPTANIRNFSIIAHVDHGKSTLSDSILQLAGNIDAQDKKRGQVLDTLQVERDRGITVKAQTVSMIFHDDRGGCAEGNNSTYLLNLIDTPGHVDFSYEVSRSLASCQGALLLVDCTQSVQAQTLSTFYKAQNLGLNIVPIVTKIDLPNAEPEDAALTMEATFGIDATEVIMTSAKQNIGIKEVLYSVIDNIPSPLSLTEEYRDATPAYWEKHGNKFHGRIIDSWYDEHRGVICLVQGVTGTLKEGMKITMFNSLKDTKGEVNDNRVEFSVQEIGVLSPSALRTQCITEGQVCYVIAGLRSTRQARIGDTVYIPRQWRTDTKKDSQNDLFSENTANALDESRLHIDIEDPGDQESSSKNDDDNDSIQPFVGYESAKSMLFASIFPVYSTELEALFDAVDRLILNDSSVTVGKEQSAALGAGLRCGFLGFLHMEVFTQRLSEEFNIGMHSPRHYSMIHSCFQDNVFKHANMTFFFHILSIFIYTL